MKGGEKMKKFMLSLICFILIIAFTTFAFAEWVSGYYRSNGTYVKPYYRSDRNSTVTDNYSFKGNYNPYTGRKGTNYYRSSPSSPYYDPHSNPNYSLYNALRRRFGW